VSVEEQPVGTEDELQFKYMLPEIIEQAALVFVYLQWLIGNMTDPQAILGGTLRAPGIHGEIEIKVSKSF